MSMILSLVALSEPNISRVLADPPLVWQVISPDDPEIYEAARASQKRNLFARLFTKAPTSAHGERHLELSSFEGDPVDLDKAWHGIHYLLTGTAWDGTHPLNFLVAGGKAVGDIDVGYGPARTFSASEVRNAHEAMAALSDDDLMIRFDAADMMAKEIYPEIWDDDSPDDDPKEYLIEYLNDLRGFLKATTNANLGMVVYIA